MDVLDILLKSNIPKLPEKEIKLKRLSNEWGQDVIFSIRALTYNRVVEIKNLHSEDDMGIHIMLEGVIKPNLRDEELKRKYNAPTPVEMVKAMLLPGEIEDISRAIERLSGYRITTVEEVKKK